ncbi:hypothetical protein ACHAXN_005972 [Cyclotella atomus]
MIISFKEGTKLAEDLSPIRRTVEWKSPDGAEGKGGPDALIDLVKNGWVMVSSYGTITKPFVCVDTEYGRIVVTFTMIANVND